MAKRRQRFVKQRAWAGRQRTRYAGKAKGILGMSTPYVVGIVLGLTDLDKVIPAEIKLGAAIAPGGIMKGSLGQVKAVAQGMLLGDLIQSRTGFNLLGGSGEASTVALLQVNHDNNTNKLCILNWIRSYQNRYTGGNI